MIRFDGTQSFPLPAAEVAAKLSDAGYLATAMPDVEIVEAATDRAVAKLKPKLSFVSGGLTLEVDVIAREAGKTVTHRIVSKAIGATSTVTMKMEFQEDGSNTKVLWVGELVAVTGLLKMVPHGLMEGSAKKVIEDVWTAVRNRLLGKQGT